jgi:hypothetical protein
MFMLIDTSIDNTLAAFGLGLLAPNSVRRTTVFSTFVATEAAATLSGALLRNTWEGKGDRQSRAAGDFMRGFTVQSG